LIVALSLGFVIHGFGEDGMVKHGIEFKIAPLKISQQDLIVIMKKVHSLVREANHAYDEPRVQESLSISGYGITITQEGEPQLSIPLASIDVADSVNYYYYNSGAAVSLVHIKLRSFTREISIEGKSQEHIESLAAYIRQSFDKYTIWFGGFRACITLGVVIIIAINFHYIILERNYFSLPRETYWILSLVAPVLVLLVVWLDLFHGIGVYRGDVSFYKRYKHQITLISLIVGLIALFLGTYLSLHYSKPSGQGENPPSQSKLINEKDTA
jgi:hypothetical protein